MTSEIVYLNPREAAAYIRSSTSTLAKRRLYGGGPEFCRIGRAIRYCKADLDEFMVRSRSRSTFEQSDSSLTDRTEKSANYDRDR
jgi:N-acetylglutamate synthase/N-acetylornithine aminotransferase